jgi:polyhydroxybutyrate depolymerase
MRAARLALVASLLSSITVRVAPGADITVGGNRPVTVHVPESYEPEVPMALLFVLHGYSQTAANVEALARILPLADLFGFLYAFPEGTYDSQGYPFWNATDACCNVDGSGVDDSGYLRALIEEIRSELNVDERQIYLIGESNGGFMAYRMACDHADVIAAIVSFAGMTYLDSGRCTPSAPVHVLQWHGTADPIVAYAGGTVFPELPPFPGAMATVRQWAVYNGCSGEPDTSMERMDLYPGLPGTETSIVRYFAGCDPFGSAELWTVAGGVHEPPLGPLAVEGAATTVFALRAVEWLFEHPKGPVPRASFKLSPPIGRQPLLVTMDGSESATPEGTHILSYEWDFGDGTSGQGVTAACTYASPGRFPVRLKIRTDDGGRIDTERGQVNVACASEDISPWVASEVGGLEPLGGARLEVISGDPALSLCAGGTAIGPSDGRFFFVHQEVGGDFSMTARISEATGGNPLSRVGVLLAEDLDPGSPFAGMFLEFLSPGWRFRFSYRIAPGASATLGAGKDLDAPPGWVRVQRRGNLFTGSSSLDGQAWDLVSEVEIPALPAILLAGAAAAGRDSGSVGYRALEARLSNLAIVKLEPEASFIRGDCNDDGRAEMSDAIYLLGYNFLGTATPACMAACDFNGDGMMQGVTDAVHLLTYRFVAGPAPPGPFPSCGPESLDSSVALACETPPRGCAP